MDRIKQKRVHRITRHNRIRQKLSGTKDRPRFVIFRSQRSIYAQVIDDTAGNTIAAERVNSTNMKAASDVAKNLAEKLKKLHITALVFDRGGYSYHGVIKQIADILRQEGLEF